MIKRMYDTAKRAVAFNMLDAAHFPQHELLVGHDPEKVVAFCKTLSDNVQLRRGYLDDDFAVFMYKSNEPASKGPGEVESQFLKHVFPDQLQEITWCRGECPLKMPAADGRLTTRKGLAGLYQFFLVAVLFP